VELLYDVVIQKKGFYASEGIDGNTSLPYSSLWKIIT